MFDLQKELNAHLFADAGWEGQRLINTAKVLRGNKLHAKEQAKIWLLKNKHIANRSAQFTEENLCTIRRN